MPSMIDSTTSNDSLSTFTNAITERPETFLHPTEALHNSSLVITKRLLDPLAKSTSVFDQIYTEGMHIDQIWQQIKLISETIVDNVLDMDLPTAEEQIAISEDEEELPYMESDEDVDSAPSEDLEMDDVSEEEDTAVLPQDGDGLEQIAEYSGDEEDEEEDEEGEDLEDDSEDGANGATQSDAEIEVQKDVFGLNDEFFDIDEFNRQTEIMDANFAQEQSEDDIDYNADPDEASDADDLEQEVADDDEENANEIRYDDFFAPPKRSFKKVSTNTKRKPRDTEFEDDEDLDGELRLEEDENEDHTIARMQKDLFADEGVDSDDDVGPKLSAHAKRQMKLAEEIAQLENDNVAKKDWTLMGEASARARPKDSLLEEGLDFERTSRPVPIVTEEITQTLEDMIKARIVEGRFDTVVRKIPESVHKFSKNSFELDENKPTQSLAEVYETEFQKKRNPGEHKTASDLKIEAEHKEIENLFRDICYNLDSLSSWHYTPKPVTESLSIVTNAPAIEMEDAQPLTMSSASRLAPHEQYTVSAEKGEVARKSGLPVSKAEMSSEERQRYRRQQRAVAKKSGAQKVQYANLSKSKQEQAGVVDTLKRANVKVIRNGKTRDLKTGRDYGTGQASSTKSANLKL